MKLLSLVMLATLSGIQTVEGASPEFTRDVKPILERHCAGCHSGASAKASLDVGSRESLIKGGVSGPAIVTGSAESSSLYRRVSSGQMPPASPLAKEYVSVLREWIESGARSEDPGLSRDAKPGKHWAFQSPVPPTVPQPRAKKRVRNPIDAFVLARLESRGLSLSTDAAGEILIRRVTYDLTGLPPTPDQMQRFLEDRSPAAYERYVDGLLASPGYGERWARHWLDAAGYADSEGVLAADVIRSNAWRYRDYVIRSMNNDKPYDEFIREQLAGDEISEYYKHDGLPRPVVESLTATGFLRTAVDATREDFLPKDFAEYQWRTLFDTEQIVASSLLGLTMHCARCHDHKYEPLTQRDYYSMQSIFSGAIRPSGKVLPSYKRIVVDATQAEQKAAETNNGPIEGVIKALKQLQESRKAHFRNLHPKGEKAAEEDLRTTFAEYAKKSDDTTAELKDMEAKKILLPSIRALYDQDAQPPVTQILLRGDPAQPGDPVEPGIPAVLEQADKPFQIPAVGQDAKTTGRRRAFAEWITRPDHPLTARVFVNRIWNAYFGSGIVTTLDNFGQSGAAPSNPELLDWLATEFVAGGWKMKALHRMIVTSSTYRQASTARQDGLAQDPANLLLWRMTPRRLEAEAVRDAVLAVAGTLDAKMYGESVFTETKKSREVAPIGENATGRRSIYQVVRRSAPQSFLNAFDAPVMEINCVRRARSTSATQALALMNGDFVTAQAEHFAKRIFKERPVESEATTSARVRYAFRLVFGRDPSGDEFDMAASFLERQNKHYPGLSSSEQMLRAMTDLCHTLLGTNEFIYLD
jgi:hypothetical protein